MNHFSDPTRKKVEEDEDEIGDNRQYVVRYSRPGSTDFHYQKATDTQTMIRELEANASYEFAVKVKKGRRESAWSVPVLSA